MVMLDTLPRSSELEAIPPSHRILVVEDEESIREAIAVALEEEGYEVHAVADGRDALAILQEFNDKSG